MGSFNFFLLFEGQHLATAQIKPDSKFRPPQWVQGSTLPTHFTLVTGGGDVTKELRPGVARNRKTKKLVGVVTRDGLSVMVVVTEGTDPKRPSWNYTVEAKMKGALAGCSKCGDVFTVGFDPEHDAPLCPKCRKVPV